MILNLLESSKRIVQQPLHHACGLQNRNYKELKTNGLNILVLGLPNETTEISQGYKALKTLFFLEGLIREGGTYGYALENFIEGRTRNDEKLYSIQHCKIKLN
jgi:hypothetical protein